MPTRTGKKGKPSRKVRLEDIAERCGVSLSTVSRALAGEKGVRPDIRSRIAETAKSLNYSVPSSLAGRRVILVASSVAMIDYVRNQFTAQVLEGLHKRAELLGVEIVTQPVSSAVQEMRVLQEAAGDDGVAGFLFLTLDDEEALAMTRDFGKPVVLVNGDDPLMRLSSVTPCNRSAARMGADYLQGLGHERILFLMRRGRRTIERRFEGWRDALTLKGNADPGDLFLEVEDWLPELAADAIERRISERSLDFSAVLAAGESLAVGAMMGLQRAGYRVPEDVSVMGMDDLPQAAFYNPPLTSVHIPMREIGAAALDLLLDSAGPLAGPARRIELACHIVERQSTAPAPEERETA
ncbi:LacI family DNA-binding transcriptional regulator [Roseibium salinum]|uniref:LacI family DNA-binding transcriptional regulator n=1 Tax=Roseibium salinum TaxID=1604349 RepID=A0ABT3QX44_9HYPH|nr:LacI family DNA-binding transcriptional regulator [Roseibium sp. DSM 29163]MCX2721499.1 LacI family DNA-binding transcriptional regulator [Roseibium sp. DSM 29163]